MTDNDDEWPDGEDMDCESCGEHRVCQCLPDPYRAELAPDQPNEPRWVCRDCYRSRAADV